MRDPKREHPMAAMSDEEFYRALAFDRGEYEVATMTPARRFFIWATCWLLGSGVVIALACGVLALARLLFSLFP